MLLEKNPEDIKKMFDNISNRYDFVNNIISFGFHKIVKKNAINDLGIKNNIKVLDLCCGSGDLGQILKKKNPEAEIIGVDFSSKMIEIAKKNTPSITYLEANATNLPFVDNEFNLVLMGFGLRNIKEYRVALNEIKRVLKPNGLFLHLDFNSDSKMQMIYDFAVMFLIKFFVKDIEPYKYLLKSKRMFFSDNELIQLFKAQGFNVVKHKKALFNMISYQIMSKN